MIDFNIMNEALKAAWIPDSQTRSDASWKIIPEAANIPEAATSLKSFLSQCNYDVKFLQFNNLPDFYSDILKYWQNTRSAFQKNTSPSNEIIWNNHNITIDGKAPFYKICLEKNILRVEVVVMVEDLLNNSGNFLPFQGVKLTLFSGSHLAPKYFKVVANSIKLVAIMTQKNAMKIKPAKFARATKRTLEWVIYNMKGYLNPRWCLVTIDVHVLRFGNKLNEEVLQISLYKSSTISEPRPHVSGYFRIHNFFFPEKATVHTHQVNSTVNPEKNKSALQSGKK